MIDNKRLAIIDEARTWTGTPYHHQASLKGVGVDCVGLINGVGIETGMMTIDPVLWRQYAGYSRTPNPHKMRKGMHEFLISIEAGAQLPGDIVWIKWREDMPMHLAILGIDKTGRETLIHANNDFGRVVEHGFTKEWQDRVDSWWRYPGLADEGITS